MNSLNINISKVCRTCLEQKDELISLYSVDNITGIQLCEMILQITSQVQVFTKENAPSSICSECHYKLNITFQFIEQCKHSEIKLQEFLRSCPQENDVNVNDREIEAAVQELFGNEESEQDINLVENVVLPSDLDSNLKSTDLLNMDMILGEKTIKKCKKFPKSRTDKKNSHLDQLLKTHKERMKLENSSKLQIFKQKRKKKITALSEPEQCFQCGKVFHYKGYMELHLRTHSGYKQFECGVCAKKFTQLSNLNLHLRIHSKERNFCCDKCPKMFSTSSNLKAHLRTHISIKSFPCPQCTKAFKSSTELKSHEGTHSQIKSKICKFCGKSFYKTSYLNVHIKNIHYGLKKYHCDSCNKSFSNSSNLIAHKRIHTGDKPYQCNIDGCSAKFNQSSSLVRHIKSHNKMGKSKGGAIQQKHQVQNPKQKSQDKEILTQEIIQQNLQTIQHLDNIGSPNQQIIHQPSSFHFSKQLKKTPYIIPELLKDIKLSENSTHINESMNSIRSKNLPYCQQTQLNQNNHDNQHSYIPPSQNLLPEILNPINLISNSSTSSYNPISTHSTPSLLLPPLPPNHDQQINDHQIHHYPSFENSSTTTYFPTTPNILPNSFNFIMSGLDFSKNSLNGEPTYIDY
ncbi:unnamed protein product [Chironomus riparius]|uniref:Zinc finger protein n=1 Tax=Chironomus riparius TaxID=315576 RepID=A0A9N9RJF7_9DIPT|nr:unnamed protein product [Chironomus riparius]